MQIRLLVLCALPAAALLHAQSISITSPASGATWSGWTGQQFAVALTSAPSVVRVCYSVDAYPAANPGADPLAISGNAGALYAAGCSNSAPFSLPVNTFWWADNTAHTVSATAYDALGNLVAASSPATFAIANTWPVSCSGSAPQFNVTASTAFSSAWSGTVNVTATMSGSCASDNLTINFYIDGILRNSTLNVTTGSFTIPLDTTQFSNGAHVVAATALDTTNGKTYSGALTWNVQAAGEQSNTVTFSNGAVPMEVRNTSSGSGGGGRTLYIAPLATATLTPKLINTDQSVASGTSFYFWSNNTNVATVSPSGTTSGTSATVTAVAQGAAKIYDMAAVTTVTDALPYGGVLTFQSATLGTHLDWINRMLVETSSANGCIPGIYFVNDAFSPGAYITASSPTPGTDAGIFTNTSSGPCTVVIGPTRVAWALVNSTNAAISHFSNTGSILSSYTPGSSIVLNEIFTSINETQSQIYPTPYLTSICASGFDALEFGVIQAEAQNWSTDYSSQSVMSSDEISYLQTLKGYASGGPCNPMLWLTGDNMMRSLADLYAATQGGTSARNGSTWSTSGIATIYQAVNTVNAMGAPYMIGMTMVDEYPYLSSPMQGPITLGGPTNSQNWLGQTSGSITCTSTTCTVMTSNGGPNNGWNIWQPSDGIIITGSTQGFNTPTGGCYVVTKVSNTEFTFPNNYGVAAGTYTYTQDPNLRIWDTTACTWYTPPGGSSATDFTWDDAVAYMKSQINSAASHIPSAPSMAGDSGAETVSCVNGGMNSWCGQSLTENGAAIYALGDFDDQYWTHEAPCETYLAARSQLNGYINDLNSSCFDEELPQLRAYYGSYDPALPMETISQGTSENFGYFSAQPLSVASCSGNMITFSSAHHIVNFLPGWAKLWITGSTDPNCNTQFVILSAPTSNSFTVARAATSQTCTDTGGCASHNLASAKLTFQNGDTYCSSGCTYGPMYEIQADGAANGAGNGVNRLDYGSSECAATGSTAFLRHRGQTFTISGATGSGASYFNGLTGIYDIENLAEPTDDNGSTSSCQNYWREIPSLNGTGGTANIVPDGSFIAGRNAFNMLGTNTDPYQTFLSIIGAMLARAAGHRLYQMQSNPNAYNPIAYSLQNKGGWVAAAVSAVSEYGQTALNNQLYIHPNVESGYSVPEFHAGSAASMMWTRVQKYYLGATALNAVDYGETLESATFQSAYGYLHIVANFSNGTETRTVTLTPYETAGQSVILWVADPAHGIEPLTVISPGTSTYNLTLSAGQAAYFVFPANFAVELNLPTVAIRLADVSNATSIGASCGYDLYLLPNAVPVNLGGGTGGLVTAQLMMDKNVGPLYCTLSYLGSSNQLLAGGPKSAPVTF